MNCVLDASAALDLAFNGESSKKIKKLLSEADIVYAPHLYIADVTNVLWKYVGRKYISESNAQTILALILQYVDMFIDLADNAIESLHEASRLNHPAYDMFYFTIARRNSALLITKDKKLSSLAKKHGVKTI